MNTTCYIIIFDKELVGNQVFLDRIKRKGMPYSLFDGTVILLKSTLSSQEIYKDLSAEPLANKPILVMATNLGNYFGFMESNLWGWLKEQHNNQ